MLYIKAQTITLYFGRTICGGMCAGWITTLRQFCTTITKRALGTKTTARQKTLIICDSNISLANGHMLSVKVVLFFRQFEYDFIVTVHQGGNNSHSLYRTKLNWKGLIKRQCINLLEFAVENNWLAPRSNWQRILEAKTFLIVLRVNELQNVCRSLLQD